MREAVRASELAGVDSFRLASLGACLAASGQRADAESILAELAAASPQRYVSSLEIAYVRTALGWTDEAFESLEQAVAERTSFLALLRVDPRFDPLRADPRFPDLLRRIGL